jgi:hypothetical protein
MVIFLGIDCLLILGGLSIILCIQQGFEARNARSLALLEGLQSKEEI